ncbi:MAG: hypothetical protein KTR31_04605 [Myxococcales bacterium]|nr:hypothetical protein [Myxococcales bacterium]
MAAIARSTVGGVPQRITGSPLRWGRDLAIVGAVTGFAAPAAVFGVATGPFLMASILAGLGCGLILGAEMPAFLESARRRLSLGEIAVRCVAVGGGLGAFVGLVAAEAAGQIFLGSFAVAGLAGALQFGWLWLPYTVLTVLERPTWPVVLAACLVAPVLGHAAVGITNLLIWLAL